MALGRRAYAGLRGRASAVQGRAIAAVVLLAIVVLAVAGGPARPALWAAAIGTTAVGYGWLSRG